MNSESTGDDFAASAKRRQWEGKQEEVVDVVELSSALARINTECYKSLIIHQVYINKLWRLQTKSLRIRNKTYPR